MMVRTFMVVFALAAFGQATFAREAYADPPARQCSYACSHAFTIDPIADGAITLGSFGFAATTEVIVGSGEFASTASRTPAKVPGIDRVALRQNDRDAAALSSVGVAVAFAYAIADPLASTQRDSVYDGLADATLYAEAIGVTYALTNLTKIAVRRARPNTYGENGLPPSTDADRDVSFFSGHTALTAGISSTATYLAFTRAPGSPRAWITLTAGAALTTFVAVERVRAGVHFPTDVITGAIVGTATGIVVPHLHRSKLPVSLGVSPETHGATFYINGSLGALSGEL